MANRLETLKGLVEKNPGDSFSRYALAMELTRGEDYEAAAKEFEELVRRDPDYAAAYFHAGQVLEKLDRPEEARRMYTRGIEVTTRQGNAHARGELEAALALAG